MRRVAVTGIGMITPIGTGRATVWRNLIEGVHGIGPVQSFDTSQFRTHIGAEVKEFCADDYVSTLETASLGRASQFAIAAARLALLDAGLDPDDVDSDRAGISMGTTSGEPNQIESFNDAYADGNLASVGAELLSRYPCHLIASYTARELNFRGINTVIPTACAAGNHAIAHASDVLRAEQADLMLAGGSDAFSRITYSGFAALMAIAPEWCQPFDKNRRGMIPGEGAAVLVLEPLDRALRRNAVIYAEVAGYGLSCDAHHPTGGDPEGKGAVRAMESALTAGGIHPDDVSYISAHGTGTKTNDLNETIAVKRVFGEAAYRIPISSIKSMLGHTMGAASAIEAAMCALAIHSDRIPPTIHLNDPDPDCDLDYVANQARDHRVEVAMSNAYAFGGNNASVILKKVER